MWMISRKSLVFSFLLDLSVFLILFRNFKIYNDSNYLRIIILPIVWGLSSYLFSRYTRDKKYINLLVNLYELLINSFVVLFITYFFDKLIIIFFQNLIPIGRDSFILIWFLSYLLQSLRILIFNPQRENKKSIYIVGDKDEVSQFINKVKSYLKAREIEFFVIDSIDEITSDRKNFKSVILAHDTSRLKNSELVFRKSIKDNMEILTKANWCEKYLQKIPSEYISNNSMEFNSKYLNSNIIHKRLKRFGDILLSLILIVLSSPIIIIFGILIKLEDNGPIFYRQLRTGIFEENILITKLRSMKINSEELVGPVWADKQDKRITKTGFIIRKSRIDELPQLWSVLIGDMSLIGPRPERPEIEKKLTQKIANYKYRHIIKPGLSGWAQVNYHYGSSIKDSSEKLSYDLFYIQNQSIWLDILILIKTIKIIFTMKGSMPKR